MLLVDEEIPLAVLGELYHEGMWAVVCSGKRARGRDSGSLVGAFRA